jgi:hypothetical protein
MSTPWLNDGSFDGLGGVQNVWSKQGWTIVHNDKSKKMWTIVHNYKSKKKVVDNCPQP